VLRKAKVISYKDLKTAQAKHVIKDTAKATKRKGKRGQKRKGATPKTKKAVNKVRQGRKRKSAVLEAKTEAEEAEEPEPEPKTKIARTNKTLALSRALVIQTPITKDKIVLKL
jgi:hypothetical protein